MKHCAKLELLRHMQPAAGCPPIPLDRVLFNAGNIAADAGNKDAARSSYEETLREAESHAAGLDLRRVAPDIRNNLGQLLLRMASEGGNDRALLRLAQEQLDDAANTPAYRTRHYAYLGLARVALTSGSVGEALEKAAMSLTLEPQYEDALDFVAELARSDNADTAARAGILFIGHARLALPPAMRAPRMDRS